MSVSVQLTTPGGAPLACPVTVSYATSAGTALGPADFTHVTGPLTFVAGTLSGSTQPVTVPIVNDSLNEANETFTLGLSGATGAAIGAIGSTAVTIIDNDPPQVSFSMSANSVSEGQTSVGVAVRLWSAAPLPSAVSVSYATANGTAGAGQDYTAASGVVTFAAGATNGAIQTIAVALLPDPIHEGHEAFTVTLSGLQPV